MNRFWKMVATCLTGLASYHPALANDTTHAPLSADALSTRPSAGESLWLEAAGRKFPALYREAITKETRGGVILLHRLNASPDAKDILQPLRSRLPERGWNSLALQTPSREAGADWQGHRALLPEAVERIRAGVAYLQAQESDPIALVGYESGALMVLHYLAEAADRTVIGTAIIDPPVTGVAEQDEASLADLGKINVPLLDILSTRKGALSSEAVQTRKRIMKNNNGYRQIAIANPDSGLRDVEDLLINRIQGWLVRILPPAQKPARAPLPRR